MSYGTRSDSPVDMGQRSWSARMADAVLQRGFPLVDRWRYEAGVVLCGLEHVWRMTGDARYWQALKANMDAFVASDGSIRTYRADEYNLDQINQGKLLFPLFRETRDERYRLAAFRLREQLKTHPRTSEGGFWHKLIYPHQMWLDGVYMAGPFLAEFAAEFAEPGAFGEVAREIVLMEEHARDPRSGLLYHGWDESREQRWADPVTGCSPHFWGRAMGWYGMALVDVLDLLPVAHPQRADLIAILRRFAEPVVRVQDEKSAVWFQILDQPQRPGNYLESSASCMFVYTLAKGVRQGHLDIKYLDTARRGYEGILHEFIGVDGQGWVSLKNVCSVGGLGGTPYRDGSSEYYLSEKVVTNDHKGVGAFLLAACEMEPTR